MESSAVEALERNTPVCGIRAPSMLSNIAHFDMVNGFVPYFLHCALLGVARQFVTLWFDSKNHKQPWYIGKPSKEAIYDKHIKGIFVPKEVRLLPRSITSREHWKGNEFKTFVLYHCLLTLKDILPNVYLNHFVLFVWALHKLLGTSVSHDDIAKAEAVLNYFVLKTEQLYGISNCTFNVHQLSHLAKSTAMCGPLWAVSTFVFEDNNTCLKNMIQGTQYVSEQVCHTYALKKTLPLYLKQTVKESDKASELLQTILGKLKQNVLYH
jgi:hypothetical protein